MSAANDGLNGLRGVTADQGLYLPGQLALHGILPENPVRHCN